MSESDSRSSKTAALKSTSIIGGSSAVSILIRMVRTKVLAVLLGPGGVGLEGMLDSAISLVRTLFDLGLGNSGVRQIAAAAATGDERRIAITIRALRLAYLVLGFGGAATVWFARAPIARWTFGNDEHAGAVGWLSLSLLLGAFSGGQGALLQGLSRIGDLARIGIIGTLGGALTSIPIVYIWGRDGIPAYMIASAAVFTLIGWYYTRGIRPAPVRIAPPVLLCEVRGLVQLGLAFLASALISTAALFALRSLVTREFGVEGAGYFQAASALSLIYVGFILQAMGTDFYPRLTALAQDNVRCNRTVNEQAEISLLLATPGVLGTLALAPWVIHVFYSAEFSVAARILEWQICGMLLRVISWPMGFIIMAKGRGTILVATEIVAYSVYLALAYAGMKLFGITGAGMAFLGLYVFHSLMIYLVVRKLTGFSWTASNRRIASVAIASSVAVMLIRLLAPEPWATLTAVTITMALGVYCLRALIAIVGRPALNRYAARVPLVRRLQWFREA